MTADISSSSLTLESQLLSIMDVLVKAAVAEISQLFSESSASLRLHLSQSLRENEALRMRMKVTRSELFSLRLQTRTSRFSPLRANTPKTRAKPQVVVQPPETHKAPAEVGSVTLQPENKPSATQTKCADEETPDVILIKDEDDVGGCAPVIARDDVRSVRTEGGADTGAQNLESSCLTGDQKELRIVSVHGTMDGALREAGNNLFTAELQAFSSLSPENDASGNFLLNFNTGGSDRAAMRGMQDSNVGMARNGQLEKTNLTQTASTTLNTETPVGGADSHVGYPSHVSQFSQQQNVFPYTCNKSLDCSFCGKCFLTREELIVHRATHTGGTPVPCSFCGKSFVNKATLTIHMRIHTGEKPYACTQCGKRFTQNGSLKIHLRTHSGEKPYTCNQCTASFNNPSNLRRHMITHNTNEVL